MNTQRRLLWILVVLVAAAVGRWSAPTTAPDTSTSPPTAVAEPAASEGASNEDALTANADTKPVVAPPVWRAEAGDPATPAFGFDVATFFTAMTASLDDATRRAEQGQPGGLSELAGWMEFCQQATSFTNLRRLARPSSALLANTEVFSFIERAGTACSQWLARTPWITVLKDQAEAEIEHYYRERRAAGESAATPSKRPASAVDRLRRRAADAGDIAARTRLDREQMRDSCGPRPQPMSVAQGNQLGTCLHATLRQHLMSILASRDPLALAAVPQIFAAHAPVMLKGSEFVGPQAGYLETDVRWTLVACRFGLDCGAGGPAMRGNCLSGICGYANYRDFAADRLLTPAAMRKVDGQVPRLVALILAGDVDSILGPPPG